MMPDEHLVEAVARAIYESARRMGQDLPAWEFASKCSLLLVGVTVQDAARIEARAAIAVMQEALPAAVFRAALEKIASSEPWSGRVEQVRIARAALGASPAPERREPVEDEGRGARSSGFWRYQPVITGTDDDPVVSLCECYFDENDRLTAWTEIPSMSPQGDDEEQLSRDLVRMLVAARKWIPEKFSDLRVGMTFRRTSADVAEKINAALAGEAGQ